MKAEECWVSLHVVGMYHPSECCYRIHADRGHSSPPCSTKGHDRPAVASVSLPGTIGDVTCPVRQETARSDWIVPFQGRVISHHLDRRDSQPHLQLHRTFTVWRCGVPWAVRKSAFLEVQIEPFSFGV